MKRVNDVALLFFLIFLLLVLNYSFLDDTFIKFFDESEFAHVDRVIDGDTFEAKNRSIRLLGINTPERGELFYEEAKIFLEDLILNETVRLEYVGEKYDKYNRLLAYVFLGEESVNIPMVENGFANYYFYSGRDKYSNGLEDAWQVCLDNNINLCEKSENFCSGCIEITENKIINSCSLSCDITGWEIKGEGREKFIFSEKTLQPGEEIFFVLSLEDSGRTVFLRDSEGKLIKWEVL